jgi:MFS family permease
MDICKVTYWAAAALGSWLSDPLNEFFGGRRSALFASAIFTFAASIGSAFTYSWQSLFACRLVLGIGYGAKASVVPIFESEIAPAEIRGRMLVSWQTFTAIGIFLGCAMNCVLHGPTESGPPGDSPGWRTIAWRLQIASCAIPAFALLLLTFCCSE